MPEESRKRIRLATIIFWVLLSYIIAALVWWFFSLYKQNELMTQLRTAQVRYRLDPRSAAFRNELSVIAGQHRRNIAKYIGEGTTFFLLSLVGAVYLYRSVRNQFRAQQQQQNFMMAITHELKTPLSVARLNLETLQRYQLEEARRRQLL